MQSTYKDIYVKSSYKEIKFLFAYKASLGHGPCIRIKDCLHFRIMIIQVMAKAFITKSG